MDWITEMWTTIEPYAVKVFDWLVETGIMAGITMWFVNRANKKNKGIGEEVATKVADKIVTKDVKVSLESVNKKQLNNIKEELTNTFKDLKNVVEVETKILGSMAKVMVKFKATSEEEKIEIADSLNELAKLIGEKEVALEKVEPTIIEIEPVEQENTNEELF